MKQYLRLADVEEDPFGGLEGETFREFLYLYCERSDFFSLTVFDDRHPVCKALAPFQEQTTDVKKWFGYVNGMYQPLTESIFRAEPQAAESLLQFFDNVYLDPRLGIEDLAFFLDDRMILGTLSHEYTCQAEILDAAHECALRRLAEWEPLPKGHSFGLEQIRLSELPVYASMPLLRHP